MLPIKPSLEEELQELENAEAKAVYHQHWKTVADCRCKIRKLKKQISDLKNLQLNLDPPKPQRGFLGTNQPRINISLPHWFNKRPEQVFARETPLGIREAMQHGFWLCAECQVRVEIGDPDKRRCPRCGSQRVHFKHG